MWMVAVRNFARQIGKWNAFDTDDSIKKFFIDFDRIAMYGARERASFSVCKREKSENTFGYGILKQMFSIIKGFDWEKDWKRDDE